MKFLVLALCVCAASAASYVASPFGAGGNKPYNGFKNTVAAPAFVAAKAVVTPGAVASATYQAANQVVNQAYQGSDESQAGIVRSESDVSPNGYRYYYETQNGIKAESVGSYKEAGEAGGVVSQGSYSYNAPDGTPVLVTYTADENGYRAQSDSLPVGPAIPEAIARSLAYIASQSKDQKY